MKSLALFMNGRNPKQEESTFYFNIKPMVMFNCFAGICPLRNVAGSAGSNLKVSPLSFGFLWGLCLQSLFIFITAFATNHEWKSIVIPHYILKSVLFFLLCSFSEVNFPDLCRAFDKYDKNFRALSFESKLLQGWKLRGLTWFYLDMFTFIFAAVIFLFPRVIYVHHAAAIIYQIYSALIVQSRQFCTNMFFFMCYSVKFRITDLKCALREHLDCRITRSNEDYLERVRLLYVELLNIVRKINDVYGLRLTYYIVSTFFDIMLDLCEYFYMDSGSLKNIAFIIYDFALVFSVVSVSGGLSAVNEDIWMEVKSCPIINMNNNCKIQMQMMSHIMSKPILISGNGFCTLNKGMLVSFLMAVVTNFIVVIQFSSHIKEYVNEISKNYTDSSVVFTIP